MMHSNSKERGMIFNAEMVRAILSGQKTQTRRIVKGIDPDNFPDCMTKRQWALVNKILPPRFGITFFCPAGNVGDRIWVRETWARYNVDQDSHDLAYRATTPEDWPEGAIWRPSIHMPRWASRILLEITNVRVERLNDISEEDAIAEGCRGGHDSIPGYMYNATPHEHFHYVWGSIYGDEDWEKNPWVWCISFKRVQEQSND